MHDLEQARWLIIVMSGFLALVCFYLIWDEDVSKPFKRLFLGAGSILAGVAVCMLLLVWIPAGTAFYDGSSSYPQQDFQKRTVMSRWAYNKLTSRTYPLYYRSEVKWSVERDVRLITTNNTLCVVKMKIGFEIPEGLSVRDNWFSKTKPSSSTFAGQRVALLEMALKRTHAIMEEFAEKEAPKYREQFQLIADEANVRVIKKAAIAFFAERFKNPVSFHQVEFGSVATAYL